MTHTHREEGIKGEGGRGSSLEGFLLLQGSSDSSEGAADCLFVWMDE